MQRVFLDANVLFSVAYKEKAGLLRLWRLHGVKLVTSEYAAEEAAVNLTESVQRDRLAKLLKDIEITRHVSPLPALPADVTLPEKDAPILQAAMSARATVLLTGDVTHFGRYFRKTVGGIRILTPGEFLLEVGT
jgi:predicted nucleic acid-binding protein